MTFFRNNFASLPQVPNADAQARKASQRIDHETGAIYTKENYAPERDEPKPVERAGGGGEDEEEEEEEPEDEEDEEDKELKGDADFPQLPPEIIQRLLRRPEDMVDSVGETLRRYKTNALRLLEDYMADHDQQYMIELDANLLPSELFQVRKFSLYMIVHTCISLNLQPCDY